MMSQTFHKNSQHKTHVKGEHARRYMRISSEDRTYIAMKLAMQVCAMIMSSVSRLRPCPLPWYYYCRPSLQLTL